jgi:hypothetical protein
MFGILTSNNNFIMDNYFHFKSESSITPKEQYILNKRCWDNFFAENYSDLDVCSFVCLTPTTDENEQINNICCLAVFKEDSEFDSDDESLFKANTIRDEIYKSTCSTSRKINIEVVRKAIYKCFKAHPKRVYCEKFLYVLDKDKKDNFK